MLNRSNIGDVEGIKIQSLEVHSEIPQLYENLRVWRCIPEWVCLFCKTWWYAEVESVAKNIHMAFGVT